MKKELEIANKAADIGREIAMKYWRADTDQLNVKTKSNWRDLVTVADLEVDQAIRELISKEFPDHGIISEEADADKATDSEFVWVLDPIDGTANYTMGLATFGVSIGLLRNSQPFLGVVDFPALDERYTAEVGQGTYVTRGNQRPARCWVSDISNMKDGRFSFGFNNSNESRERYLKDINNLLLSTKAARIHYSCVFDFTNVARGGLDFYINYDVSLWDYAATWCIAVEAGADVVNLAGDSPDLADKDIIVTNGRLTKPLLNILTA